MGHSFPGAVPGDSGGHCVQAHRDREPWRGRDAAHSCRPRPQRRAPGRRADPRDRARHGRRAHRHVRSGGRRGVPHRAGGQPSLPRPCALGAGSGGSPSGRRLGRLGVRRRGSGLRRPVRPPRDHVHRPVCGGDAQTRRQDRLQADRRGGRGAGGALEPRRRRFSRGRPRRRRPDRLPADAQGDGRRWRSGYPPGRHPRRSRRRLPAHPGRGRTGVRLGGGLPGAADHRRPPRRGAGDRRRPGNRVGARRPGLLGPAAQPEGDRGVRLPPAHP